MSDSIQLRKLAENNLKGFDLDIPLGTLTIVTGVSGAGKSSLSFKTLYAEGQRRFVESLSPYARQFLEKKPSPRAASISALPPTLAVRRSTQRAGRRSTVGTLTDLNNYLRVLFAQLGVVSCPQCAAPVHRGLPSVAAAELAVHGDSLIHVGVVCEPPSSVKAARKTLKDLASHGCPRMLIAGVVHEFASIKPKQLKNQPLVAVVASVAANSTKLAEQLSLAQDIGDGLAIAAWDGGQRSYTSRYYCAPCDLPVRDPTPACFSFNHPLGACEICGGLGEREFVCEDLVVVDGQLSVAGGAIAPWGSARRAREFKELLRYCEQQNIPIHLPWIHLDPEDRQRILDGDPPYRGVVPWLERAASQGRNSSLKKFLAPRTCDACGGARLNPEACASRIDGLNLPDMWQMPVAELAERMKKLQLPQPLQHALGPVLREIRARVECLTEVGLGYLQLDRCARTLSGGEIQRVQLTSALSSNLAATLYLLDEPTTGLHARDIQRLIASLRELRDRGNTVLVVEHDINMVAASDFTIDLGPNAGDGGGELLYAGPPAGLVDSSGPTGDELSGRSGPITRERRVPGEDWLYVRGANCHNLKDLDVSLPLEVLVGISGVSGSGKSTLLEKVLAHGLVAQLKGLRVPEEYGELAGAEFLSEVVLVDQSPLVANPRANPATYTKAFDKIRNLFAESPEAVNRGLRPSDFSFNVPGGRCSACEGAGFERIEMQFLADVFLLCEECNGTRFSKRVLEVKLGALNVAEVLALSVDEALEVFAAEDELCACLRPLTSVGLGYLNLGRPLSTLSGGEAQRLKLAAHLMRGTGSVLFLLDEPTTGLHTADIRQLLSCLDMILACGHSVIAVEHNLEFLAACDWLIDLGPDGGDKGGELLAACPPEELHTRKGSFTGESLAALTQSAPERFAAALNKEPRKAFDAGVVGDIEVEGAQANNLRGFDLKIPRGALTVVTGPSGSGKSSLVFDILFAEGQRRFIEALSADRRRGLRGALQPKVTRVRGLPPTAAISQLTSRVGSRSTVGTALQVAPYIRLIWARLGEQTCPECGVPLRDVSPEQIIESLLETAAGKEVRVLAPVVRGDKGYQKEIFRKVREGNYDLARVDGTLVPLRQAPWLDTKDHNIDVLVGTITVERSAARKLLRLVNTAFELGRGWLIVGGDELEEQSFSKDRTCPRCDVAYPRWEPSDFSFLSRRGRCPRCLGRGKQLCIDPDSLVSDPEAGLGDGALGPFVDARIRFVDLDSLESTLREVYGIPWNIPWNALSEEQRRLVLFGPQHKSGNVFEGLCGVLERLLSRGYEAELQDYLKDDRCPECQGGRLRRALQAVKVRGSSIADVQHLAVEDLHGFFAGLLGKFNQRERLVAAEPVQLIQKKLSFLLDVGLPYLELDRDMSSLSGGEVQRVRLATQLAGALRGVLFILDEPTVGLHPVDGAKLVSAMRSLQQSGNTVVVVEHDEQVIRSADYIVDMGPGGGTEGGRIVCAGPIEEVLRCGESLTARHLRGELELPPPRPASGDHGEVKLLGARGNNLKGDDVSIPLAALTVVTGLSGAGKSSLVVQTLYRAVRRKLGYVEKAPLPFRGVTGCENLDRALFVDQKPIGRTSRSCPASYTKILDEIRNLFAATDEATARGFDKSHFSFNTREGRCDACAGQGVLKLEMDFLPSATVPCETCNGCRFRPPPLSVKLEGCNIAEVLALTVSEARAFFQFAPKLAHALALLEELGLGYLTLGQPSPSLSGGEAQRIKLASELLKKPRGRTLYVLDEPTTGLHAADVVRLIGILRRLTERGDPIVVIEHNPQVILAADSIVDLGPKGGSKGGHILVQGTLEEVTACERSVTGKWLRAGMR